MYGNILCTTTVSIYDIPTYVGLKTEKQTKEKSRVFKEKLGFKKRLGFQKKAGFS